jgi:hypothetical protein
MEHMVDAQRNVAIIARAPAFDNRRQQKSLIALINVFSLAARLSVCAINLLRERAKIDVAGSN